MTHCWKDLREAIEEEHGIGSEPWVASWAEDFDNGTCMLEDGHEGPHQFTDDNEIGVRFEPEPPPEPPPEPLRRHCALPRGHSGPHDYEHPAGEESCGSLLTVPGLSF